MTEQLSSSLLSQLSEFVADRMGFYFPPERWLDLERGIRSVTREFEFDDMESCAQWLLSSPVTQSEIEILASHLAVGETYFFRERQSFEILEKQVLPELIRKRRDTDRRLRIWSAGCCTGEEPYSIAIVLNRILPDLKDWQINIVATDINPHFLKKAVDGVYGEWSFRGVSSEIKERYFAQKPHGRFEVQPEIKRMVTFSYLNLVEDTYPSFLNNTNAMDVIFGRNVLMYFASERAKQVVRKLHLSLSDGGWLVVSHNESSQTLYSQFAAVNFPGTVFYKKDNYKVSIGTSSDFEGNKELPLDQIFPLSVRRAGSGSAPAEPSSQCLKPDVPEPNKVKSDDASYAKSFHLYEQGCYEEAAQTLLARLIRDPDDCKAMALLARVYANQGRLAEANRWCERALAADKLSPSCHILHATILKEQGAIAEATRALQRALYLDQNLILAHFALGNIARQQEKIQEATRHFDNARTLLGNCSPDQVLPEFDCMTAGRLMEILRSTFGAQVSVISDEQRARTSAAAAEKWLTASAREAPR